MNIRDNILSLKEEISDEVKLVAVSKTRSIDEIKEAYNSNQKIFDFFIVWFFQSLHVMRHDEYIGKQLGLKLCYLTLEEEVPKKVAAENVHGLEQLVVLMTAAEVPETDGYNQSNLDFSRTDKLIIVANLHS